MAEVLSIVAASVQLVELFAKIVLRTNQLHKQLKDAPDYVRRQAQSLDHFQTAFSTSERILQHHSIQIDSILQPEDVSFITALLRKAEDEVNYLTQILAGLKAQPNGRWETVVQATRTVRKEKGIAGHILELCDIQTRIDSFFTTHSWHLIATQSAKTRESFSELLAGHSRTHTNLVEVRQHQSDDHSILDGIQTTFAEVLTSQNSVSHEMVEVKTEIACLQESSHDLKIVMKNSGNDIQEHIKSSQQSLSRELVEARAGIVSLHESNQGLQSIIRSTGMDTQALISREFEALHSSMASLNLLSQIDRQLTPALQTTQKCYDSERSLICPCQRFGQFTKLLTLGPVVISRRQYGLHHQGCQWYSPDNVIVSQGPLCVELIGNIRSPLIAAVMARLVIGTSSFLSGPLGALSIVDGRDTMAPGFVHMYEAQDKIHSILFNGPCRPQHIPRRSVISTKQLQQCQEVLKLLQFKLQKDFNSSRNWCRIQTSGGRTLLHEMTEIFMCLWTVQNEVADCIRDILRLLVQGGTSLNATAGEISERHRIFDQSGSYTALTVFIALLRAKDLASPSEIVFLQLLSQHDIPAFSTGSKSTNRWMVVRLFVAFPDLAIEYGCVRLSLAVIERDRDLVKQLLHSGAKVNDVSQDISALSFAVGWTAGIKILLAAGAESSQAIRYAIMYQDSGSLELLLDHDHLFFEPPSEAKSGPWGAWSYPKWISSLLDFAIWQQWDQRHSAFGFDKAIFRILIQDLASSRSELGEIAKKNLSNSQLRDLGWSNHRDSCQLIDSAAGRIFEKLQKIGIIDSKRRLWPGTSRTVYHNVLMTADVAELLFITGFSDIDESDINGLTPLLLNTHMALFKDWKDTYLLLSWFFDHGAKKLICSEQNNSTFLHKLAAHVGTNWPRYEHRSDCQSNKISPELHKLAAHVGTNWPRYEHRSDCQSKKISPELSILTERAAKLLPHQPTDACQCFCSSEGCSPIHSLIKHMLKNEWRLLTMREWWACRQKLFNLWNDFGSEVLDGQQNFTAFCRIELFERLRMKHTCCRFEISWVFLPEEGNSMYMGDRFLLVEQSQAAETRAADAVLSQKLESLMSLYGELSHEYLDTFQEFWKTWWFVMEDYAPPVAFSWSEAKRRKPSSDGNSLPIPIDTLKEVVSKIQDHIRRSLRENQEDDIALA